MPVQWLWLCWKALLEHHSFQYLPQLKNCCLATPLDRSVLLLLLKTNLKWMNKLNPFAVQLPQTPLNSPALSSWLILHLWYTKNNSRLPTRDLSAKASVTEKLFCRNSDALELLKLLFGYQTNWLQTNLWKILCFVFSFFIVNTAALEPENVECSSWAAGLQPRIIHTVF